MARRRGRRDRPLLFFAAKRPLLLAAVLMGSVIVGVLGWMFRPAAAVGTLRGQVIYIDPGHGGIDPGACGDRLLEKDVVLQVAFYLGARLEMNGARVVYSRTGDYDLETGTKDDVEERIKIIESSGATMVISLHCNAFGDRAEWGAQTFYNAGMNPKSKQLAEKVQAELIEATGSPRAASARLDHFMLNHAKVPSVTVELGFLSNPREEGLLGSHSYQQKLADCIKRAVLSFAAGGI